MALKDSSDRLCLYDGETLSESQSQKDTNNFCNQSVDSFIFMPVH